MKEGKHFTCWCEQQWKKWEVPRGCQNQVDAGILCSLNRQQAKNDNNLLHLCLLTNKLNFSKALHNSQEIEEQVKQFHNTPVPPNTGNVLKSPASKAHGLRDKNVEEKSARKSFPRKKITHPLNTNIRNARVSYKRSFSFAHRLLTLSSLLFPFPVLILPFPQFPLQEFKHHQISQQENPFCGNTGQAAYELQPHFYPKPGVKSFWTAFCPCQA